MRELPRQLSADELAELFEGRTAFVERLAATDDDGRAWLAEELEPGSYDLVFHPPSPFFRRVELRIELADGHYHVPLLVSPFSCASYRGS